MVQYEERPGQPRRPTLDQLAAAVRNRLRRIPHQPDLITALLGQTRLTLGSQPAWEPGHDLSASVADVLLCPQRPVVQGLEGAQAVLGHQSLELEGGAWFRGGVELVHLIPQRS
jgi:hypothetical protein